MKIKLQNFKLANEDLQKKYSELGSSHGIWKGAALMLIGFNVLGLGMTVNNI